MEQVLVSNKAIINNLRRTMSKGFISLLTQKELNDLALKYFGVYENGTLVGYQCPYSGKILTNIKKIVLEHIIPVSRGGGTALFNCIPTSEDVNKSSEKGTDHLISWWINSKYWDTNAFQRLEKLVQYMLEGYDKFSNNSYEYNEIEDEYDDNLDDTNTDSEANLTTTQEEQQENEKNTLITYYQFINDALNVLKKYINVDEYQNQLQILINKDTFKQIERATLVQNSLKNIIKDKLEIEDRSELTYVSYFNIIKLTESLKGYSYEEIYKELENRIDNIDKILSNNNLSLFSLITDKNSLHYLYKEQIELSNEDISQLIQNINMCILDKFNSMIDYVSKHDGLLPSGHSNDEKIRKIGKFRTRIQYISRNTGLFPVKLTKEQLEYLHNSEYESLREIYKTILNKAIENDIEIDYVDEEMKRKILEFKEKSKFVSSLEEQIELEKEYSNVIVIKSQFNKFIDFVIQNQGNMPQDRNDDTERRLNDFRYTIQKHGNDKFNVTLSREQLKYLHNSEYESLREIYKTILNKAIENDIEIDYVDEEMKQKILEFKEKSKYISSLEEQIQLEKQYSNYIVIESQFNKFIDFVIQNQGKMPNKRAENDEEQRSLGLFKASISKFNKSRKKFHITLSREQLKYLHDSQYLGLREIYKSILNRTVENNVEIDYVDQEMKQKILEFKEKSKYISSLEEQIELEKQYSNYIVIENQFNEFIDFVINNNRIPKKEARRMLETEKRLGQFLAHIQSIDKNRNKMHAVLTKEQLEYLHNSDNENLQEIYYNIIEKARQINYLPYIEIDNELELNRKGRAA